MASYPKEIIEKYRGVLKKTPDSQVFAPLAEAYRENGELELAEKVCKEGLRRHPTHTSAWVILGKILKDRKIWDEGLKALTQALKLSGGNILAHQLMGDIYLEKRDTSNAIKSYKMVLLLNPNHTKVKKILERIESLSAKDYADDLFEFKKLSLTPEDSSSVLNFEGTRSQVIEPNRSEMELTYQRTLQRIISLIDAFIARNQLKQAAVLLENSLKDYPEDKDLLYRQKVLKTRTQPSFIVSEVPEAAEDIRKRAKQAKLEKLNKILQRIHDYR
ncbi:MAG: tetratricopeptide repeat protein [Bdellovibrionaceae bacterium]|nr:tetratricopeptide repeat protein [Pseudobdellovibrionaceae bacterium]